MIFPPGMASPSLTRAPSRFRLLFRPKFCCSTWHKESYHVPSASRPANRPGSAAALHDLLHGCGGQQDSHFSDVARIMESVGVPAPSFLLTGAIVFLLAGSLSVIVGY